MENCSGGKMLVFGVIIGLIAAVHSTNLPPSWKICKRSDPNLSTCLKDAIQGAVTSLMPGNPSLGVMPIDPIHINKFSIRQGSGPVSINLDLVDVDALNLKFFRIVSFEGDWKSMKVTVDLPKGLDIKGKYKVDGKILTLPIKGEGPCELKIGRTTIHILMTFAERQIKGKTHFKVDKFDFNFNADALNINLENLFGGDKALSDNTNKFLNDNWSAILNELQVPLAQGLSEILVGMSDAVFSRLTKDQISPP